MKTFISNIFIFLAFIALIAFIASFFGAFKKKNWKDVGKNFLLFVVFVAIGNIVAPKDGSSSSDKSNSKAKTEKVEKTNDDTEKENDDDQDTDTQSSTDKSSDVNADISSTLADNKSYAQNGNADFQFANYINDIKYTGGTDVTVNVNNDFMNLPDDQKKQVLDKVQSSVGSTLLMDNKISNDDYKQGLFLTINLGGNSVGHSKISDYHEYKFYKQN